MIGGDFTGFGKVADFGKTLHQIRQGLLRHIFRSRRSVESLGFSPSAFSRQLTRLQSFSGTIFPYNWNFQFGPVAQRARESAAE
jgi:hypothetical protein